MIRYKGFYFTVLLFCCSCAEHVEYPFQDVSLPMEQRVEDLVSRLTLQEKVAQMTSATPAIERLGIPAYDWQNECLHGVAKLADYKVTVYPQPIGMAATWDKEAIHQVGDYIAEEGRAVYNAASKQGKHDSYYGLTYWAPNINIFRDPRWGRGHETFGEDPYLTGALGKAFVKGLQGDDPSYLKASACAKHYAVHSGPESLRHEFSAEVNTYDLWDTYLPAFRDLIVDANVSGVMCAYNAYAGKPCCGNDLLMMDILRNKWGFKGYVTSDCGAIDDFYKHHHTHADTISAAVDAVLNGTDLDCIRDVVFKTLGQAVSEGRIKEQDIDKAVKRLFTVRFKLGMFDTCENKHEQTPLSVLESKSHTSLALKMARESIVLLKNEQNVLPLSKSLNKIAVVGPNADTDLGLLGNYHGYPTQLLTVLDAIKAKVSPQTIVCYDKMVDHLFVDNFQTMDVLNQCSYDGHKGFLAEYFDNIAFEGVPEIRWEEKIELHYRGEERIISDISSLAFSARYTTKFTPEISGKYTLNLNTDKRFLLSLDDQICLDSRTGKAMADGKYTCWFEAGREYKIKIEVIMKGRHGDLSFGIGQIQTPTYVELAARVKDADVIIFVGGISPALEGEENGVQCKGFEDGDRTTIVLPKVQTALMKELKKTGKPIVFVMLTGSAIAINWENDNIPAIVNAWYGGQAGGKAVADVLFGDYNPSGRLPVTFYKSDSDLPTFTDYSMEGRTYRYFKRKPLYPFGYGLSYTSFTYKNLDIAETVNTGDSLIVKIDVTNNGSISGEEVTQLYITHIDKEPYLPLRSLKGFTRVSLSPGETKTLTFVLLPRDLATFNDFGECTIRQGKIRLCVGGGQPGFGASVLEKVIYMKGDTILLPF